MTVFAPHVLLAELRNLADPCAGECTEPWNPALSRAGLRLFTITRVCERRTQDRFRLVFREAF